VGFKQRHRYGPVPSERTAQFVVYIARTSGCDTYGSPNDRQSVKRRSIVLMENLETLYSLGGNTFYAVAYALLVPPQIYLGVKYRTWGFLFAMFCGLVLEVIGYAARIRMSQGENQFVMYAERWSYQKKRSR
jgi:hypothetical protein